MKIQGEERKYAACHIHGDSPASSLTLQWSVPPSGSVDCQDCGGRVQDRGGEAVERGGDWQKNNLLPLPQGELRIQTAATKQSLILERASSSELPGKRDSYTRDAPPGLQRITPVQHADQQQPFLHQRQSAATPARPSLLRCSHLRRSPQCQDGKAFPNLPFPDLPLSRNTSGHSRSMHTMGQNSSWAVPAAHGHIVEGRFPTLPIMKDLYIT